MLFGICSKAARLVPPSVKKFFAFPASFGYKNFFVNHNQILFWMRGGFSCDCKCICGACKRKSCGCECHDLDPLNDHELMDVIIREGGKMVSDVYGKNRNQLMQIIVEQCSNPMAILRAGVKMIQTRLKNASRKRGKGSSSRLDLLKRVAEKGDAAGIARILALDNEKKKKAILRPISKPKNIRKPACKATKPVRKPTSKPKPARKPNPARRCATS